MIVEYGFSKIETLPRDSVDSVHNVRPGLVANPRLGGKDCPNILLSQERHVSLVRGRDQPVHGPHAVESAGTLLTLIRVFRKTSDILGM